jgi:putative transposase
MRKDPERYVLLYQDEGTFYRQPSQGFLWSPFGRKQPRMPYSHRSNTRMRVVAYLDAGTGEVHQEEMNTVTAERLAASVSKISKWYPDAARIFLVWDNWPNHYHPDVQRALAKQDRLTVLPLPTYSPWLNPTEKVWRWVRQRVAHAHPWCDDFREFRNQIYTELDRFKHGSPELLRYVGLSI